MENNLSPNESLDLIQSIINKRKHKYEENGLTILVWGILVFIAGTGQYLMIKNGLASKSYYSWLFTMIPGFIITMIAGTRNGMKQKKQTGDFDKNGLVWSFAGTMAMCTGFVFNNITFGPTFTLLMFLPFCVASFSVALQLRENLFIACSILSAIIAYASIYTTMTTQPLFAGIIGLTLMTIPGTKLFIDFKKRQNV